MNISITLHCSLIALCNLSLRPLPTVLHLIAAWKLPLSIKLGKHRAHLIYFLSLRDNPSFYPMPDDLRAIALYILSGRVVSGERVNLVSVISS